MEEPNEGTAQVIEEQDGIDAYWGLHMLLCGLGNHAVVRVFTGANDLILPGGVSILFCRAL